jgi:CSLREA domain-containing protein
MRFALQKSLYVFLCLSLMIVLVGVQPAYAASITVTTTADENNTGASCSLREAITAANNNAAYGGCAAGSGTDTITLPAGTYTLSSELPAVTSTIIINGNGASNTIIQANANPGLSGYRILTVNSGGNLTLNSLTAKNGYLSTGNGSGIYNSGTLTITNSAFSGNVAFTGNGGGVYNDLNATLVITNSTFSANSSGTSGGGVNNIFGATTTITNSTFSGNSSGVSGVGGGVNNAGTITIRNSTFSGNSASISGGGISNGGTLNYANTIIANSTSGADCTGGGSIGTNTNNLVGNGGCSAALSGDPNLGPLADNGGPTQTMALLYPSPALNAGDDATCAASPVNNLDQRGMTRPQGTHCDIGAYEVIPTQSGPAFVVNSTTDTSDGICDLHGQGFGNQDCTLREAIASANIQAGANTITFDSTYVNAANRITLNFDTTFLPTITTDITITGNGSNSTIIQAGTSPGIMDKRIFTIQSPGNLTLNQVTLQNGRCASLCTSGGAILNSGGTLTVNDSLFSENIAATFGGNITNSGTLVVNNSTFIGNASLSSASIGGGIYNVLTGTATIRNSTFSGIYSNNSAIYNSGVSTLTLVNDTIIDNHSTSGSAGALAMDGGTVNIYNTTISGNTGTATSDNIHQISGNLNLYNTIVANSSSFGDCVTAGGTFSATNSLIENNGAQDCGVTNGNNGNITGSGPNLGPLDGSPAYFTLNTGSPAIDAGSDSICTTAPVSKTSQNGVTRPQGLHCDIGAYEFDPLPYKLFLPLILR